MAATQKNFYMHRSQNKQIPALDYVRGTSGSDCSFPHSGSPPVKFDRNRIFPSNPVVTSRSDGSLSRVWIPRLDLSKVRPDF